MVINNIKKIVICFLTIFIMSSQSISLAEDLRMIVNLEGKWLFSIGDDPVRAETNFDDSQWDYMYVPSSWENEGYVGYNGFAWYRKHFRFPDISREEILFLHIKNIDDVDEVFINGNKIGQSGKFPPREKTAWGQERKYVINPAYINYGEENVIAIRVFDSKGEGGLVWGPVRICIDEDISFLSVNLSGDWKFKLYDNRDWKRKYYDDSDWKTIYVPSFWENQGYEGHDGYAWYRKKFRIPSDFKEDDLYLVLGMIDDIDQVYLNGEKIGEVYDLPRSSGYRGKNGMYKARRGYKIPTDLLIRGGVNVVAVRVYDYKGPGGIYAGPVGIMTGYDHYKYNQKHEWERTFWDELIDLIFYD
jgi:hypothetical protein